MAEAMDHVGNISRKWHAMASLMASASTAESPAKGGSALEEDAAPSVDENAMALLRSVVGAAGRACDRVIGSRFVQYPFS